jgi:ubiquinol-cytochrome c reductase cytochrome b subunit
VLLIPGILVALIAVHLGLVWYQKHTQFPGPGRTERNVVGVRILPIFATKASGFAMTNIGVICIMAGLFQINPIWNFGPYNPAQVSAASQPDWYVGWLDGSTRLWPAWEIYLGNYMIPASFWPTMVIPGIMFALASAYPAIERKLTKDNASHNLLQRPRDVPVRTGLGMMAISFMFILLLSGGNDVIAYTFDISLNATTWAGRIGMLLLPPIAYYLTYRICLGLQRADRSILEHGIETGIIKRLPHGEFIEVHQPLGGVDDHGHPIPLEYQGARVPKRMNQLGSAGSPLPGSIFRPDPPEQTRALEQARHAENGDGISTNGSSRRRLAGRPQQPSD